ncbi:MAG: DUF4342 domain-containing protein [Clostridia bacterium]|nr:DUF4342 domain-containing protein [Clostridia bacterium]
MSSNQKNRWFSLIYRTRVRVFKDDIVIVNLSLIFMLLAVLSAPWLVVGGLIAALALGYRFSIERNAAQFSGDFNKVVRDAAQNVRNAVDGASEE